MAKAGEGIRLRFAPRAFATEIALLLAASCAIGYGADLTKSPTRVFALFALTAVAYHIAGHELRHRNIIRERYLE